MKIGDILKSTIFEEVEKPTSESPPVIIPTRNIEPTTQNSIHLRERVLAGSTAYLSFLQQVTALEKHIPDHEQRYILALATTGALGISAKDIETAIDKHIGLLRDEKALFDNTMKVESEKNLSERRSAIDRLTNQSEQKKREIAALQAETTELESLISDQRTAITAQEQKIEQVRQTFSVEYEQITQQLTEDKQRLAGRKA